MSIIRDLFFSDKNLKSISKIATGRSLSLLDIGARGGIDYPWSTMNKDQLSLILVEPDPEEARLLSSDSNSQNITVLPYALWRSETTLSLNINNSPGTSSVYKPNNIILDQFPDANRFDAKENIEIETKTVDKLADTGKMPNVDFAKIDVQGAELAILEGGVKHFSNELIGLEVEVEFSELYKGQPLFSDVEVFVRKQLGLELWDIKKTYWKHKDGIEVGGSTKGKLVFGDALFLRPLIGLDVWLGNMDPEKASEKTVMLIFSAIAYGYLDYAKTVLETKSINCYLETKLFQDLNSAISTLSGGIRPLINGHEVIYLCLEALASIFKPTYQGWASTGRRLGSRKKGSVWL